MELVLGSFIVNGCGYCCCIFLGGRGGFAGDSCLLWFWVSVVVALVIGGGWLI